MGLIRKILFAFFITFMFLSKSYAFGNWIGPEEVVHGLWGNDTNHFGIRKGDTEDRLPILTAIRYDKKVIINDQVNKRVMVFNPDGSLNKLISWHVNLDGHEKVNPELSRYHYWNIQGYTPNGGIWVKFQKYYLKSQTGEMILTENEKPLELGVVKEQRIDSNKYRVTVKYPDKEWIFVGEGACPQYIRDTNGNLYCLGNEDIIRYNNEGEETAKLTMPKTTYKPIKLPPEWPKNAEPPRNEVNEEYGSPVLAPNGDVYTWKRTPYKYSIIKWSWQD